MEALHDGKVTPELEALSAAVSLYLEAVAAGDLSRGSDPDVLAELRELETLRRRLAVADHALITEIDRRGLAGRLVMPSTSAVLQGALRLSPYEARHRVAAAKACAPQATLTGEPLPAVRPRLSEAQSSGQVSSEHTRVILTALKELPATLSAEDYTLAEKHLVEAAITLRPHEVSLLGERLRAYLHPDGTLAADAEQQRLRNFVVHPNTDGSYTASGRLTPACGGQLLAWLTPRSAPQPSDDAGPDPRHHGQRMHDALEQLAGVAIRRTELVESGAPAQVIITMTADQLSTRQGLAETSFGQLLPVEDALRMADEASLHLLLRDQHGAILNHGRTKRIATRSQTLALTARDQGCTFRAATSHPNTASGTTSPPGPTAAEPTSTTSPCSAATTTANSTAPAGAAR
ncbi:MAG: hypothetical protein QOI26_1531 [Pseudonocardiales bacterium]|nr:hypothetical protein [Pseudonocardiales bacterium]